MISRFLALLAILMCLHGCTKAALIGDSITVFLGADAGEINLAVPSKTTTEILNEQLQPALDSVPFAVAILGGTNDLIQGRDSIEDLQAMARTARAAGSCVILATLPPCTGFLCPGAESFHEWDRKVLAFAYEERYPIADYHRLFIGHPEYQFDGVHPNAAGVAAMRSVLEPLIDACPNWALAQRLSQ